MDDSLALWGQGCGEEQRAVAKDRRVGKSFQTSHRANEIKIETTSTKQSILERSKSYRKRETLEKLFQAFPLRQSPIAKPSRPRGKEAEHWKIRKATFTALRRQTLQLRVSQI